MDALDSGLLGRYGKVKLNVSDQVIKAERDPSSVTLIAVSKTHPFSMIETLYSAGHRDFGENYVQELVDKANEATKRGMNEIRWHFIGHLQTNKVKILLPHIFLLHTLDRLSLYEEIVKRIGSLHVQALLEVNIDHEESKSGLKPAEVESFLQGLPAGSGIDLKGWMAIPKPGTSDEARASFRALKALAQQNKNTVGETLSMGMSSDYGDAISEGANYIRVGTAIFGER